MDKLIMRGLFAFELLHTTHVDLEDLPWLLPISNSVLNNDVIMLWHSHLWCMHRSLWNIQFCCEQWYRSNVVLRYTVPVGTLWFFLDPTTGTGITSRSRTWYLVAGTLLWHGYLVPGTWYDEYRVLYFTLLYPPCPPHQERCGGVMKWNQRAVGWWSNHTGMMYICHHEHYQYLILHHFLPWKKNTHHYRPVDYC